MWKASRWLFAILVGAALLALGLFAVARFTGPNDHEKAALKLLESTPEPPGRNGFAALWLMPYNVPETDLEKILAEDVRLFSRTRAPGDGDLAPSFTSVAKERYPAASEPDRSLYCQWRSRDCLEKVRADSDAYARQLEADAALLARADSLSGYGHVRSAFPQRLDAPFPPYQYLAYPMTRHAHAFVLGEVDQALDGACRGISTARMLIVHGDNLVSSMIGAAMLQGNAALLGDMLAELPPDRALPPSCALASAPAKPDEFSACPAMRGEARFTFTVMQQIRASRNPTGKAWQAPLFPIFYDAEKTKARMAPRLGWYCSGEAHAALLADVPVQAPPMQKSSFACVDNFIGCVLADIASPGYDEYQRRLQDAGMRLKAISAVLWLRGQPASEPVSEHLARLPPSLRSPRRELRLDDETASLLVDMFDTRDGPQWQLPLPASRLAPAGAR